MLRVISIRRCTPAAFKLTKLFGIDDFSAAKVLGRFLLQLYIYCFNNYYYYHHTITSSVLGAGKERKQCFLAKVEGKQTSMSVLERLFQMRETCRHNNGPGSISVEARFFSFFIYLF